MAMTVRELREALLLMPMDADVYLCSAAACEDDSITYVEECESAEGVVWITQVDACDFDNLKGGE